ncbi:hypothetical protein [Nocardia carnea]|uniref:hypothetical protein n=1 Tax=Nocardia carnea TaxID=37328 RepID=UPI00245638AE|nr:hypothetical protein [Nocardia carnea]
MAGEEVVLDDDPGMSRHMANVLGILSSAPGLDKDFKAQIQAILQGTGTIRDLAQSEAFDRVGDSIIPQALADFASIPEDERERMAAQGEAVLESYRHQDQEPPASQPSTERKPPATLATPQTQEASGAQPTTAPGRRKSYREQVVGPTDSEDEDDRYFRERNQNGWLQ